MKKYLEVEKVKKWFREREVVLTSADAAHPTWSADDICRILDMLADDEDHD